MTAIALHLGVDDPDTAAAWYVDALGAEEVDRLALPDGRTLAVNGRIKKLEASLDAELSRREALLSLKSAVNGQ